MYFIVQSVAKLRQLFLVNKLCIQDNHFDPGECVRCYISASPEEVPVVNEIYKVLTKEMEPKIGDFCFVIIKSCHDTVEGAVEAISISQRTRSSKRSHDGKNQNDVGDGIPLRKILENDIALDKNKSEQNRILESPEPMEIREEREESLEFLINKTFNSSKLCQPKLDFTDFLRSKCRILEQQLQEKNNEIVFLRDSMQQLIFRIPPASNVAVTALNDEAPLVVAKISSAATYRELKDHTLSPSDIQAEIAMVELSEDLPGLTKLKYKIALEASSENIEAHDNKFLRYIVASAFDEHKLRRLCLSSRKAGTENTDLNDTETSVLDPSSELIELSEPEKQAIIHFHNRRLDLFAKHGIDIAIRRRHPFLMNRALSRFLSRMRKKHSFKYLDTFLSDDSLSQDF